MGASSPFLYIIWKKKLSCQCVVFWSLSQKSDNIPVKVESEPKNVKIFFILFAAGSPAPLLPLAAAEEEEASGWGITRGEASTTWVYKTNIFLNINSKVQLTNKQHWTQVWLLGIIFLSKMPLLPKQKQVVQVVSLLVWKIRIFYKFPPSPNPRAATTTTTKATTTVTTATTSASTTPASSAPSTSSPGTSPRARQATSTRSQTSGPPLEVHRKKQKKNL